MMRSVAKAKLEGLFAFSIAAILAVDSARALEVERAYSDVRSDIVVRALTLIDTPYRYGGSTPATGFDCSGLVRYVYNAVGARPLPRHSEEMGKLGDPITRSQLEPGDLVFFNTLARAYSHVAIYIGDGRFLHAPARSGRVRIEALNDRYWQARFDGARRLIDSANASALAGPAPFAERPPHSPIDEGTVVKP